MNAVWFSAFGAMLIPLGVVLMLDKPENAGIAFWIVISGFVSLAISLALTVWEERQKQKRERAREIQEVSSLLALHHIALALGVDMDELLKEEQVLQDKEKIVKKARKLP